MWHKITRVRCWYKITWFQYAIPNYLGAVCGTKSLGFSRQYQITCWGQHGTYQDLCRSKPRTFILLSPVPSIENACCQYNTYSNRTVQVGFVVDTFTHVCCFITIRVIHGYILTFYTTHTRNFLCRFHDDQVWGSVRQWKMSGTRDVLLRQRQQVSFVELTSFFVPA